MSTLTMLKERDQVQEVLDVGPVPFENLLQTLVLGLLVVEKHDKAAAMHGPLYQDADLAACDEFMKLHQTTVRQAAHDLLLQHAIRFARASRDVSFFDRLRESLWVVAQGYAAAFLWSVTLVIIAIIVRQNGGDLIDIFHGTKP